MEPSGGSRRAVDRVALAVELRDDGMHEVVGDLERGVLERDAELLGDVDDLLAVQRRVARRLLCCEADAGDVHAVGVLKGHCRLLDLVDSPAKLPEYLVRSPLGHVETQEGTVVSALAVAQDVA